jgi:hypothetical protein
MTICRHSNLNNSQDIAFVCQTKVTQKGRTIKEARVQINAAGSDEIAALLQR